LVVDEYNTIATYSSCFGPTVKRRIRKGDKWIDISGVVACFNNNCPRRLIKNITISNRDQNVSYNISLVGVSKMLSKDHFPLPAFNRRSYKSNIEINSTFYYCFIYLFYNFCSYELVYNELTSQSS
ncbi:hypothetical protein K501DRAFT_198124, partial [Backusella circina FSU 941]